MTEKSRANYFKERRREKRAFYVELEKDKMEKLEKNKNIRLISGVFLCSKIGGRNG